MLQTSETPGSDGRRPEVFLSHNSADKPAVEVLAHRLLEAGIRPWLDKWNLIPGQPWQEALERALDHCNSCVVFIGPSGVGPWQNEEMRAAIARRVENTKSRFPVVPVLLPGAKREERSRLPAFLVAATWVEFGHVLDDEEAFHRLVCGVRGVEPGPPPAVEAVSQGEPPYRGLLFFDVDHAPFFFGREALIEWLLHQLLPAAQSDDTTRFLGIIGPSGSGKSSLARAGLVAALKRGAIAASSHWPVAILRPGSNPLESLAIALLEAGGETPTPAGVRDLMRDFQDSERALHLYIRLSIRGAPPDRRFVVLIDQFEELFTHDVEPSVREAFIRSLMYACTVTGGQTIVLLTLRADFYGECSTYDLLAAALSERQILVGPMETAQLRKAIERPAQLAGCALEPGLADSLIEDVQDQAGGLPLLEYTLAELWNRRQGRRLTHTAYQAIGGIAGALEGRAEQLYQSFSESEQQACRRIFMRLVQPSERGHLTKRRASLAELMPAEGDSAEVTAVIAKLARPDARLITIETGATASAQMAAGSSITRPGAPAARSRPAEAQFVDVSHEALLRTWGRLQTWLDQDQEFQLWQKRLRSEIEMWERTHRHPESLLRGLLLDEAKHWYEARSDDLNREERDFIETSDFLERTRREEEAERIRQLHAEQEQRLQAEAQRADAERVKREAEAKRADAERRAARRARLAAASLAAMLLAVIAGAVVSARLSKHSRAKDLADQARQKRSVELAVQAIRESRVPQAVEALYATARQEVAALSSRSGVNDLAWATGGAYVATAHADGALQLWKSAGPSPMLWNAFNQDVKHAHPKEVLSVAFHPREDLLATATAAGDSRVRVWKIGAGRPEWESPAHGDDDLNAVDFNRTGGLVAAAARSGKLTVWNRETDTARSISPPHQATTIAFSPAEDRIAAGFTDGTVIWWNPGVDSYESVAGEDQRGRVHGIAFSPDGKALAIASQRGVWICPTGSRDVPKAAASRPDPPVTIAVAYSPQGDRIAAADADGNISILDSSGLREQARITVSDFGKITAVAFQPDPQRTGSAKLAVSGFDGSVRIFELNVDRLLASLGVK